MESLFQMNYEKQNFSTFGQANKMSMNFGRSVHVIN